MGASGVRTGSVDAGSVDAGGVDAGGGLGTGGAGPGGGGPAAAFGRPSGELWLTLAAVAASLLGTALLWVTWLGMGDPASLPLRVSSLTLTGCIAPGLLVAAGTRLLWRRGLLPHRMAVAVLVLGVVALAAASLASLAFGRGIAEADGEAPPTLFADLMLLFFGAGVVLGVAAVGLIVGSLLRRTRLHRALVRVFSVAAGLVAVVPLGVALVSSTMLLSLGMAAFLVVGQVRGSARTSAGVEDGAIARAPGSAPDPAPESASAPAAVAVAVAAAGSAPASAAAPEPSGASRDGGRARRAPLVLAVISCVLGIPAAAFALTGSGWPIDEARGFDSTAAMGYGIAAGLVAAVPLVIAIALAVAGRWPRHPLLWSTWVPTGALSGVLLMVAATSLQNAVSGGRGTLLGWNLLVAGLLLYAAGVALFVGMRLPLHGMGKLIASALVGGGIAAATGFGTFMLPFLAPIVAVALAVWVFPRLNRTTGA